MGNSSLRIPITSALNNDGAHVKIPSQITDQQAHGHHRSTHLYLQCRTIDYLDIILQGNSLL